MFPQKDGDGTWYRKKPLSNHVSIKANRVTSSCKQATSDKASEIRENLFHPKFSKKPCVKSSDCSPLLSFADKVKANIISGERVLKGGGKNSAPSGIFIEAIEIAKSHGIKLIGDTPNAALGNCLFDSVIDNINHRPNCFSEKLEDGVDHYRVLWVSELEEQYKLTPSYPGYENNPISDMEKCEWVAAWAQQMNSREYNVDPFNVSDLTPAGLGHCINRNILVFSNDNAEPVKLFSANCFDVNRQIESDVPVIIAYDSHSLHYESLLPKGKIDIAKCTELVKSILNLSYNKINPVEFWEKAQKAKKAEAK